MDISDRLRILMDNYELSSSQFADKLEIQRSAISHLLSGRNKPSILILEKIIRHFPDVDINWLIMGKGNILKNTPPEQTAKEDSTLEFSREQTINFEEDNSIQSVEKEEVIDDVEQLYQSQPAKKNIPVEKIILIFQDNTFEVLQPKSNKNGNL